jgi:hypothetical protein
MNPCEPPARAVTGGFAIIHRALGKFWGGVASVLFLCMAILLTAAILDVGATFLSALGPGGVPVGPVGSGLLVVVTVLSVGRISPASWVTGGPATGSGPAR